MGNSRGALLRYAARRELSSPRSAASISISFAHHVYFMQRSSLSFVPISYPSPRNNRKKNSFYFSNHINPLSCFFNFRVSGNP